MYMATLNSPLSCVFLLLSVPSSELFDPGIYYKDSNGKLYKTHLYIFTCI